MTASGIMYVHVPSAMMAMAGYHAMAVFGARHLGLAASARRCSPPALSAPVGAASPSSASSPADLWGKPMWGTWWVWDARLDVVLVLFFLYLGLISLWRAFDDPRGRLASGRC